MAAGAEARAIVATPYDEFAPSLSPDGRWLAYDSFETDASEIYVTSFPGLSQRYQIPSGGGQKSRWRNDGRQIQYLAADGNESSVVDVTYDGGVRAGHPSPFFTGGSLFPGLTPVDGQLQPDFSRALSMTELVARHAQNPFTLVENWRSALEPE